MESADTTTPCPCQAPGAPACKKSVNSADATTLYLTVMLALLLRVWILQ
jgi:hypothetical protein